MSSISMVAFFMFHLVHSRMSSSFRLDDDFSACRPSHTGHLCNAWLKVHLEELSFSWSQGTSNPPFPLKSLLAFLSPQKTEFPQVALTYFSVGLPACLRYIAYAAFLCTLKLPFALPSSTLCKLLITEANATHRKGCWLTPMDCPKHMSQPYIWLQETENQKTEG
jgi:hypothetical protein